MSTKTTFLQIRASMIAEISCQRRPGARAPAFDGIVEVRFDSDPRLNGKPFAGFSAIVVEQLTLTRRHK